MTSPSPIPPPQAPLYGGSGSTPIPDPTVLTAQAVAEAKDQLRRETLAAIAVLQARMDGYDKAIGVLQAFANRSPTPGEIDLDLGSFKALMNERFTAASTERASIRQYFEEKFETVKERFASVYAELSSQKDGVTLQFKERDTRSERESRDNKVAVDAAFAAQKEAASEQNKSNTLAIDKSEKATAETLNKQADLFKSTTDALAGRIEDAKQLVSRIDSRVTAIESRGVGVRESQTQTNWGIGAVVSVFAVMISLAGLIVVLIKLG